jgi:putative ABC transport system substrate-binding protein
VKRRAFLTLIGGAAAAWPLTARAQQGGTPPTIGFLGGQSPAGMSHLVAAFVLRLRELGWIEGRNIAIEHRWWEGRSERATEVVAELVRLKVDIIVAGGTTSVAAAKKATSLIPIVFVAGDSGLRAIREQRFRPNRDSA